MLFDENDARDVRYKLPIKIVRINAILEPRAFAWTGEILTRVTDGKENIMHNNIPINVYYLCIGFIRFYLLEGAFAPYNRSGRTNDDIRNETAEIL